MLKATPDFSLPREQEVVVDNNGSDYMLYDKPTDLCNFKNGVSRFGLFAMSRDEARAFAAQLNASADELDNMDAEYCAHLDQQRQLDTLDWIDSFERSILG
jgi:hypothetical protein